MKLGFPVGKSDNSGFDSAGKMAFSWVVDVKGKIAYSGQAKVADLEKKVKKAMKKVAYPGLGKARVHTTLKKAAGDFCDCKFGKARKAAQKILGKDKATESAKKDAQHIIDRVSVRAKRMTAKAEAFASERSYLEAIEAYDSIAESFKGEDEEEGARKAVKKLKSDRTIKKEIKALEDLEKLLQKIENSKRSAYNDALKAFAKKHKGTKAAENALAAKK